MHLNIPEPLYPNPNLISFSNVEVIMKSYRKELWFEVPTRRAFINITPQVEECIRESVIKEGLLLCNTMHM
jgi:hypothetical protein